MLHPVKLVQNSYLTDVIPNTQSLDVKRGLSECFIFHIEIKYIKKTERLQDLKTIGNSLDDINENIKYLRNQYTE